MRALQRSLQTSTPSPRPRARRFDVRRAGDRFEAEADLASRGDVGSLGMTPLPPSHASGSDALPSVDAALAGAGEPLSVEARAVWERRLHHDFGRVRVHTDASAAQSARDLGARAYTTGDHVVFANAGRDARAAESPVMGHELAHVVQQSASPNAGVIQRQLITPLGAGGGYQGLMDRDRRRNFPPRSDVLKFYHGTRWSWTQRMLTDTLEPRGRGDFAAGFYTHFEPTNDERAKQRAKQRGMRAANEPPAEPYAGVLELAVPTQVFIDLRQANSREFDLTDRNQPDYAARQREWHQFITTHGRESTPTFKSDEFGERWIYRELQNPAPLPYDLIIGPFMQPVPGLPGTPPPPSAFDPKSEGTRLPQQVLWANNGLAVLNARATRRAYQFDARTGDEISPPIAATWQEPPFTTFHTPQNPDGR